MMQQQQKHQKPPPEVPVAPLANVSLQPILPAGTKEQQEQILKLDMEVPRARLTCELANAHLEVMELKQEADGLSKNINQAVIMVAQIQRIFGDKKTQDRFNKLVPANSDVPLSSIEKIADIQLPKRTLKSFGKLLKDQITGVDSQLSPLLEQYRKSEVTDWQFILNLDKKPMAMMLVLLKGYASARGEGDAVFQKFNGTSKKDPQGLYTAVKALVDYIPAGTESDWGRNLHLNVSLASAGLKGFIRELREASAKMEASKAKLAEIEKRASEAGVEYTPKADLEPQRLDAKELEEKVTKITADLEGLAKKVVAGTKEGNTDIATVSSEKELEHLREFWSSFYHTHPDAHSNLALIHEKLGGYGKAMEEAELQLERERYNLSMLRLIVRCYKALGDKEGEAEAEARLAARKTVAAVDWSDKFFKYKI